MLCFEYHKCDNVKNIVMNIINLIMFWTRTMTEEEQQQMRTWMPVDTDHHSTTRLGPHHGRVAGDDY